MIRLIRIIQLLAFAAGLVIFGGEADGQHDHHNHDKLKSPSERHGKDSVPDAKAPAAAPMKPAESHNHLPRSDQRAEPSGNSAAAEVEKAAGFTEPGWTISLGQLEEIAITNNPTLKQASFAVRAAEGRRKQAGLLPNPIVGYSAEELAFRDLSNSGEHGFFVEQRIPLGGKLSKSRRVFADEVKRTEADAEAQRARVLNNVRVLYLEVLNAQRLADIKRELLRNTEESVTTSIELVNVGIGDKPDQMSAEMEQQRAESEYFDALTGLQEAWQRLAVAVGMPDLKPARLQDIDTTDPTEIDPESMFATVLSDSPEIKAAESGVKRARAALSRAKAERIPDLFLRGGVGYSRERLEHSSLDRRVGAKGSLEVGVTLPIFDRNQGGIEAAEAELAIAESEVQRLKLELRNRFGREIRKYRRAKYVVEKYRTQLLPRAKAAYEMYTGNFDAMSASYTEVLEARREFLRAQQEYAGAVTEMRKSLVLLRGSLLTGGLNRSGELSEPEATENTTNEDPE